MRAAVRVTMLVTAIVASPAGAQTPEGLTTGITEDGLYIYKEDRVQELAERVARLALQVLDERVARQERAARRATFGICDGCIRGAHSSARHIVPRQQVDDNGLPYRPEDLR